MTCAEFNRALDAYLAGTLTEEDACALEEHAAGCAACEARLDAATRSFVAVVAPSLPPTLRDTTLDAVAHRRRQQRHHRWLQGVSAIAAIVLLAMAVRDFSASHGAPVRTAAVPEDSIRLPVSDPDRFAAERSSTEFNALDVAARELEAALARTPDDAELRTFLATVKARRDELTRRVKAAHS